MKNLERMKKMQSTPFWGTFLGIIGGFSMLMSNAFVPALSKIADDYAVGSDKAQMVITAYLLAVMCGQVVSGSLINRYGRRKVLLICLVGAIAVNLVSAVNPIHNIWILVILRFIMGIFISFFSVIAYAVSSDLFSGGKLGKVNSIIVLYICAIPVVLPIVSGVLVQYASYQMIFVASAILSGVVFVACLLLLPETKLSKGQLIDTSVSVNPKAIILSFFSLFVDKKLIVFIIIASFTLGAITSFYIGAPGLFSGIFEMQEMSAMEWFAFVGIFLPIGCLVNSYYVTKMHSRPIIKFFLPTAMIVALFAVLVSLLENPSLPMAIILIAGFAFCCAFILPNAISFAVSIGKKDAATVSSCINFMGNLTSVVISMIFGYFDGLSTTMIICFTLILCSTVLYFKVVRKQKSLVKLASS